MVDLGGRLEADRGPGSGDLDARVGSSQDASVCGGLGFGVRIGRVSFAMPRCRTPLLGEAGDVGKAAAGVGEVAGLGKIERRDRCQETRLCLGRCTAVWRMPSRCGESPLWDGSCKPARSRCVVRGCRDRLAILQPPVSKWRKDRSFGWFSGPRPSFATFVGPNSSENDTETADRAKKPAPAFR